MTSIVTIEAYPVAPNLSVEVRKTSPSAGWVVFPAATDETFVIASGAKLTLTLHGEQSISVREVPTAIVVAHVTRDADAG